MGLPSRNLWSAFLCDVLNALPVLPSVTLVVYKLVAYRVLSCSNGQYSSCAGHPVVPIGRSPRTDVLLKVEKIVLEYGGCVFRLAGLYISFFILEL